MAAIRVFFGSWMYGYSPLKGRNKNDITEINERDPELRN
jgi:hypothetical protein